MYKILGTAAHHGKAGEASSGTDLFSALRNYIVSTIHIDALCHLGFIAFSRFPESKVQIFSSSCYLGGDHISSASMFCLK